MSQDSNHFVLPGDVISNGSSSLKQNVILEGDKLVSTTIGFTEINDGAVDVIALTGLYTSEVDDLVIGKIVSHNSLSWEVDINSSYRAMLPASDIFGKDYSPSRDDLSLKLIIGDIVLARIVNSDSRRPLITINGQNLGKIDDGELIKISPAKVPRLIGKHGSMIQSIEESTGASITIGQNGWVIFKSDNPISLKNAIASIKMADLILHDDNLEEKIQNMLDEK
jgi:exosome complex component RRP4